MAKYNVEALNLSLRTMTAEIIQVVNTQFNSLDNKILNQKPAPDKWSVADCLYHLNKYSRFYLPFLENAVDKIIETGKKSDSYQSGWLGEYFANYMQVEPSGVPKTKMKAPKQSLPKPDLDAPKVLAEFLKHQEKTLMILEKAKSAGIDWGAARVPTTLSSMLKLKLGDMLRVTVYHNHRHVQQALRALKGS